MISYQCVKKCSKKLKCGHGCKKQCGEDCERMVPDQNMSITFSVCKVVVIKGLPCGHLERIPCGMTKPSLDYKCHSGTCLKSLPCGHMCKKTCKEDCLSPSEQDIADLLDIPCREIVNKSLPCGHQQEMICGITENSKGFICHSGTCLKSLSCGHMCKKTCKENCLQLSEQDRADLLDIPCRELVQRTLPCGHQQKMMCGITKNSKGYFCQSKTCLKSLPCGHMCKKPCKEDCLSLSEQERADLLDIPCRELVQRTFPCGHQQEMMCGINVKSYAKLHPCQEPCRLKLLCRDPCLNKCS